MSVNALVTQFGDFVSVVGKFAIKCRLRRVSRSVLAWLRLCKFHRVPSVSPGKSRTDGTRQILSTLCFQVFSARW